MPVILFSLVFATSTFDVVGNFSFLGTNGRFFNLVEVMFVVWGCVALVDCSDKLLFSLFLRLLALGAALCIVDYVSGVTSGVSGPKTLNYTVGLFLHLCFAICGLLVGLKAADPWRLCRIYFGSFFVVIFISALQLMLGLFGISLATQQWMIPDRLPRLNAFTFEPSYLATYLVMGLAVATELVRSGNATVRRLARVCAYFIIATVVLSTSRIGIAVALVYLLIRGRHLFRLSYVAAGGVVAILLVFVLQIIVQGDRAFGVAVNLLEGTGVLGTASHSVDERADKFDATVAAWLESPVFGVGLGNVGYKVFEIIDPGALFYAFSGSGVAITEETITGMNVIAEVAAGIGVVGLVIFAVFFAEIYRASRRLSRIGVLSADIHRGFLWGGVVLLIMLQFNQNILRAYVWVHVFFWLSMLGASVGACVRFPVRTATEPPRGAMAGSKVHH